MKTSKIVVKCAKLLVKTKMPEKFLKELASLCKKYSEGKGWYFEYLK